MPSTFLARLAGSPPPLRGTAKLGVKEGFYGRITPAPAGNRQGLNPAKKQC